MSRCFEDLRGELKTKIFSLLTPLERQVIRPVCTDWKYLIDEEFGIKLVINNAGIDTLITTGEYAVELELNSLTVPIDTLGFSFPSNLHTLRFHNIVVTYNLLPLLQNFSKTLTTLSFSQVMIDLPERLQGFAASVSEDQYFNLAKLKHLEVNEWNMTESVMTIFEFLSSAIKYQCLEEISVLLQNPLMVPLHLLFSGDISSAPCFLQLIKKNLHTLGCIKYGKQIALLTMRFYPYGTINPDYPIQLKEFLCHSQFKMDWLPILDIQFRLVKLHIGDCRVGMWDGIRNAVRENCHSLETFWIAGQSFNQRWDCNIFRNCHKLRKLCVQLYMSPKIALENIPQSITKLNLSGSIKRNEFLSLMENLENCEEVEFSHLGINQSVDTPEDRVNLDLIIRLVRLPKMTKVSFLHSDWNDADWEEVVSWCSNNVPGGIFFEQLFYPLHGQEIRHGIHVHVSPTFDKAAWCDPNGPENQQGNVEGMCNSLYTVFTRWM